MLLSRLRLPRLQGRLSALAPVVALALWASSAIGPPRAEAQDPSPFDPGRLAARFLPGALTSSTLSLSSGTVVASSSAALGDAGGVSDDRSTGGVLFDDAIRNGIRLRTAAARDAARTTSDVLLFSLTAAPIVENVSRLAAGDRTWSEFWLNLAVDFGALGLSWGIVELIKTTVGRERPYAYDCLRTGTLEQCGFDADARKSFLSGHTTLAFTGAGLVCAHAASGEDDVVSTVSCAASLGLASVTGVLRIMADAHYASDVLAGAFLGLAIGYLLPRVVLDF